MADPTIDELLAGQVLHFRKHFMGWILDSADCFVSQSRGNKSIKTVSLYLHAFYGQDVEFWDKLGQAIGNLQALEKLCICTRDVSDVRDDDELVPIPHWEILARILRNVRQKITLTIVPHVFPAIAWPAEDVRSFARVIRGHPTVTGLYTGNMSPYEASVALYSALATLPALESLYLSARPEDGITLLNPEILTELLRVPSLRSVCFYRFHFTSALCHAIANALMEDMAVTKLEFEECSFATGQCTAIMTNGLARNTSVHLSDL